METKQQGTTFSFLLTLGKNIVVQRDFIVNGYNPKVRKSLDLYYWATDTCNEITDILKIKNLEYMMDNYYYVIDENNSINKEFNQNDEFKLQILLNDEPLISRVFPSNVYHPKSRSCDIRPIIRKVLHEATKVLSSKNIEKEYLQYDLAE